MVDHANSYDHYDSVLCVGPHQVAEIRRREELAGLPAKRLIPHGYQRIEHLVAEAARRPARSMAEPPVVLVAPTWGDHSILNVCGEALLEVLLGNGFRVILRPHQQTVKLSPVLIKRFRSKYAHSPSFTYVDLMGESDSLFDSDLLICDWSGMAIEYALALQKPVVFIDVPPRVRNLAWEQWQIQPMEFAIREQVGVVVSPQQLHTLPETIRTLLTHRDRMQPKMDMARENYLFNFGRSVEVAAEAIVTLADQLAGEREARR
jgi:YidC/Oxa1 family membrane protein insertase